MLGWAEITALVLGGTVVVWILYDYNAGNIVPLLMHDRRPKNLEQLAEFNLLDHAECWVYIFSGSLHHHLGNDARFANALRRKGETCKIEVLVGPDLDVESVEVLKAIKETPRCKLFLIPERCRRDVQVPIRRWQWWRRAPKWRYRHFLVADERALTMESRHGLLFGKWFGRPRWYEFHNEPLLAADYASWFRDARDDVGVPIRKDSMMADLRHHGRLVRFHDEERVEVAPQEAVRLLAAQLGDEAS